MNDPENQIDAQLNAMLEQFKDAPSRNPTEAARGKAEFLAFAHQIKENPSITLAERINSWVQSLFIVPNKNTMLFRFGLAIFAVSAILLAGISRTANAAQDTVPGDLLYPVKIWVEDTQLLLSLDEEGDTRLRLEFAQNRLDEIIILREGNQSKNIVPAVTNFNKNIQGAEELLQILEDEDNPQISTLFQIYTEILAEYQSIMVDESEQPAAAEEPASDDDPDEEETSDDDEIEEEKKNGSDEKEGEPEKEEPVEEEPLEEGSGEEEPEDEAPEEEAPEEEEHEEEEHEEEPDDD